MKRKKGIGLLAITATVLLFWLMWDTVSIYLFPRLTLSGAVERGAARLWEEYALSPVYMLSKLLEKDGNYTLGLKLMQTDPALGEVQYDLKAAVQDSPRRISADGFLTLAGRELDFSVYLDEEEAAFSSTVLLKDRWYGFCFDTIARDVRGNPALSYLLGEDSLRELEGYAALAKSRVGNPLPRIPAVRREDFQNLGMGILLLDLEIQPDAVVIQGRRHRAFRLSSVITVEDMEAAVVSSGERIPGWAVTFAQWLRQEKASVLELEFVMADGSLHSFSACARTDSTAYRAEVILGAEKTAVTVCGQEKDRSFSVSLGPEEESSEYTHQIRVSGTDGGGNKEISAGFRWDATTGNLWLRLTDGNRTGHAHILLNSNILRLEAADTDPLLEILTGEGHGLGKCILTLMPGAQTGKPDYREFTEWSMDDLLLLMEGIGAFLGIQTG